jgi:hypothetical protein
VCYARISGPNRVLGLQFRVGVGLLTRSDETKADYLNNSTLSVEGRFVNRVTTRGERFAIVHSNSIVFQGICKGAVVGAGSLILCDLEPWTISSRPNSVKKVK